MKKIAILQSNYIPWKGYFDIINKADEFIIWDNVQYVKKSWRNRNYIKTHNGLQRLTIPVKVSGKYHQKINETKIDNNFWSKKHWKSISLAYQKAPYFNIYKEKFEEIYKKLESFTLLTEANKFFILEICNFLEIKTTIHDSSEFKLLTGRNESVIDLCLQRKADILINGPSAKNHMDENMFKSQGITIEYMEYNNYKKYTQLYNGFEHRVSILDLIFNLGPDTTNFMNSF